MDAGAGEWAVKFDTVRDRNQAEELRQFKVRRGMSGQVSCLARMMQL